MTNYTEVRLGLNESKTIEDIRKELKVQNAIEALRLAKEANLITPESYARELRGFMKMYFGAEYF